MKTFPASYSVKASSRGKKKFGGWLEIMCTKYLSDFWLISVCWDTNLEIRPVLKQ